MYSRVHHSYRHMHIHTEYMLQNPASQPNLLLKAPHFKSPSDRQTDRPTDRKHIKGASRIPTVAHPNYLSLPAQIPHVKQLTCMRACVVTHMA